MNNFDTPITESDFTGRYLVLLDENRQGDGIAQLQSLTDSSSIATAMQEPDLMNEADIVMFDTLGVAILNHPVNVQQLQEINVASSDSTSAILAIEPEQYFYALADTEATRFEQKAAVKLSSGISLEYLRGYRDGVANLVDQAVLQDSDESEVNVLAHYDESHITWGLQVTNVALSRYSGKGIKVAVLDTGFDFNHPDFKGRKIVSQSFVTKKDSTGKYIPVPVQDGNGHGTHCIGTACGPRQPSKAPRYGIAHEAEIYVGKVLSDAGSGLSGEIVRGIEWAVNSGCHIISMSLGGAKSPGTPYSTIYETVAQRALKAGSLIIAASGNNRQRKDGKTVISSPADCPSVMAVAALDGNLQVASFSSPGDGQVGGEIDIAAPGVGIHSSHPSGTYRRLQGTSMATPHVAGIAALYAEANPTMRGRALWNLLTTNARRLPLSAVDVGIGLVQSP
ncbi:MAG: S8 family serine peptidase [Synechococcales cyanobacterium M58_A2018_015]|nr:S8 family serine peptidase [Synechococcales cyanobacterium M58_A2018_015]